MILEAIELRNVGRFRTAVRVGPFARGLNILAANNEQGKTTVIRAAARCLFDRYKTKAEEITALQPAGTDLAPEVAVEFQSGGRRFRLKKRFLNAQESELLEWDNSAWRSVADGDLADGRMLEMLSATQPGRGASKPEHWGMFRYLWARQDEPAAWLELAGDTGDRLRHSMVKVEMDPGIERLKAAFASEASPLFTETGQVKKGGELFQAEDQAARIEAELGRVRQQLEDLEAKQADYQGLAAQVALLERQVAQSEAEEARLHEQIRLLAEIRQKQVAAQREYEAANTSLQAVASDQQELARIADKKAARSTERDRLQQAIETLKAQEAQIGKQRQQASDDLAARDKECRDARVALGRLSKLVQWRELKERVQDAHARLEQLDDLGARIQARSDERARWPRVSAAQAAKLRELEGQIRELEIQLQAAGVAVEVTPLQPRAISAEDENGTRQVQAEPAAPALLQGRRRLKIELPGWGTLVVTSGARELQELEGQLRNARAAWAEHREKLGVKDADHAHAAQQAGKDLDRDLKALEERQQDLLGKTESASAFRTALTTTASRLQSLETDLAPLAAEEEQTAGDILSTQLTKAEGALKTAELAAEAARERSGQLNGQWTACSQEQNQKTQELAIARADIQALEATSATLLARYPKGIEQAKSDASTQFVHAEARWEATKAALPSDAEQLPARRDRAVKASIQARQDLASRRAEQNRLEGALGDAASGGLYSQAASLEEQLQSLKETATRLRQRGQSARLLTALIVHRKNAALRRVLDPLERRLTAAFADLTGDGTRSVFLDEQLAVQGIGRTRENRVAFEYLSQGAKEQLLLAMRAAVAIELSAQEPQTLILDDVLVNTDALRQVRVLDYLTTLAQTVQIVVLTCHPERYAGAGSVLRLEEKMG